VSKSELDADNQRSGDADQPHEQLGPLPALVRAKIAHLGVPHANYWHQDDDGNWLTVYLCGRPTRKKRPCQIEVDQAGGACQFHGDKQQVES
jgi:hypothetical protein